jgi:hypothetical protein
VSKPPDPTFDWEPPALPPRPPRRTSTPKRWPFALAWSLIALVAGLALGDALGDRPGGQQHELTAIRGIRQVPVTETVATRTVTVVVSNPSR